MADKTVIDYTTNGENGLSPWDDFPADILVSGEGKQSGHEFLNVHDGALTSGVWDCTPCVLRSGPYDVDEFMIVLDGSITINHENGDSQTYRAGEYFVIPRGTPLSWVQTEYALKYYVIFENQSAGDLQADASLESIRAAIPESLPSMDAGDPSQYIGNPPTMGLETVYKDPSGQFVVGIWESSPMTRQPGTIGRSELMHILEGSGSITNGDGVVFHFKAGDMFMVPIGMGYQWHSDEYVKKIFCAFTPAA